MKKINFSYTSAVAIILILITLSQIAIQFTLSQEIATRDVATLMSRQELRTQRILRNSLLLVAANPTDKNINPLQVDPLKQLSDDLTFVEQTHATLIREDSPVAGQMQALQPDFRAMDAAGHKILEDRAKQNRQDLLKQLAPMFVHEQAYLSGTFAAYLALTSQADDLVVRVRWLELAIYIITICIVGYEVLGIVLPAEKDRREEIAGLKSEILQLKQAVWEKQIAVDSTPEPEPAQQENEKSQGEPAEPKEANKDEV